MSSVLDVAEADELYDDATTKIAMYADLSRARSAEGDAYMAITAAWAADVHALHALLWERGLKYATEPDEQLATVADALTAALAPYAQAPGATSSAREAVEAARRSLISVFDPSVHSLLATRFIGLEHLDALSQPAGARLQRPTPAQLDRRSAGQMVSELRLSARACMAVAREMREAGRPDDARAHAYAADLASFEAYLIEAASALGDEQLVSADLRWAAATSAIEALAVLPDDLAEAAAMIRERLTSVVGAAEAAQLTSRWENAE